MKWQILMAAVMAGALSVIVGCNTTPVQTVAVPRPDDQSAYRPQPAPKPDAPPGYIFGAPQQGAPGSAGMPAGGPTGAGAPPAGAGAPPAGGLTVSPNPSIENEEVFIAAYAKRSPRMMVFVNRTIQGDPLPKDSLDAVLRAQSTVGTVAIGNGNQLVWQPVGITSTDYSMIETSIVNYFDNSGRVQVKDAEAARSKLNREQVLRIENGDPAANRLLAAELQADLLIHVTATPTSQAAEGPAVRLIAKAVTTTDARNMGTAMVDMPFPMSKQNINVYTRYLTSQLMRQMALKWAQPAEYDPIEVRIYKAATIDDSGKIAGWIKPAPGVKSVDIRQATAGSATSYAVISVGFEGAPWMLYQELKDGIGQSQGLKAVDLSNNTITLEITGPMNLVTTTRHVESTTTIETRTTEERRVEPINPAPPQN